MRPVLVALAGDSASGKSTLARGIEYIVGVERVGRVCTDDYHRYDRATRAERGVTPLVPEANRVDLMEAHLRALAEGSPVTKPTYDHLTGTFGPDETIPSAEIVIVEGLLPLAGRAAREAIDVAVYLEPEEMLRRRWKLERDVFERGYSPQQVVDEIKRREPDAAEHVRPQRVSPTSSWCSTAARERRTTSTCRRGSSCAPPLRTPDCANWWGRCATARAVRPSGGRPGRTGGGR